MRAKASPLRNRWLASSVDTYWAIIATALPGRKLYGTLFTKETLELVVMCIVTTPLFVIVPILLLKQSHKTLQRR